MSLAAQLLVECTVLIRMKDDLFQEQHGMPAETERTVLDPLYWCWPIRERRVEPTRGLQQNCSRKETKIWMSSACSMSISETCTQQTRLA
jgi:hypothetical protein